jgi:hypothetical protein
MSVEAVKTCAAAHFGHQRAEWHGRGQGRKFSQRDWLAAGKDLNPRLAQSGIALGDPDHGAG